jgi:hypothetical protein
VNGVNKTASFILSLLKFSLGSLLRLLGWQLVG